MSQEQLGEACGLDRTWISKIERERANWTAEHIPILARGLGVAEHELFGYTTPPSGDMDPMAAQLISLLVQLDAQAIRLLRIQAEALAKEGMLT